MRTLRSGPRVSAETADDAQDTRPPAPSDLKPDKIACHAPKNPRPQHKAQVELSVRGKGAGKDEEKKCRHRKAKLTRKYREKHPKTGKMRDYRHGLNGSTPVRN
jgi:hypothetical protein